ncbi:MAG: hypothetical protein JSR46_01945, partial [Verrucomicrobia bacterium]|nr:hypothetical protein [Verrucomicrobiota bacterium]
MNISNANPFGTQFTEVEVRLRAATSSIHVYSPEDWANVPFITRAIARLFKQVTDIRDSCGTVIGIAENLLYTAGKDPCAFTSTEILRYSKNIAAKMKPRGHDTGVTYQELVMGEGLKLRIYTPQEWAKVPCYTRFFAQSNVTALEDGRVVVNKIYRTDGERVLRSPISPQSVKKMILQENICKKAAIHQSVGSYYDEQLRQIVAFTNEFPPLTEPDTLFIDFQCERASSMMLENLKTQVIECLKREGIADAEWTISHCFDASEKLVNETLKMAVQKELTELLSRVVEQARLKLRQETRDLCRQKQFKYARKKVEWFGNALRLEDELPKKLWTHPAGLKLKAECKELAVDRITFINLSDTGKAQEETVRMQVTAFVINHLTGITDPAAARPQLLDS